MTGPIIFSDETARRQLTDHGVVVTFRTRERTTGSTWWRESRTGPKRGDVTVERLREVDPSDPADLARDSPISGFESVEAWQDAIARLNGGLPERGVLYLARERDGESA